MSINRLSLSAVIINMSLIFHSWLADFTRYQHIFTIWYPGGVIRRWIAGLSRFYGRWVGKDKRWSFVGSLTSSSSSLGWKAGRRCGSEQFLVIRDGKSLATSMFNGKSNRVSFVIFHQKKESAQQFLVFLNVIIKREISSNLMI